MNIAIAPCCWGVYWPEGNEINWTDYLDRIKAAGYRHTELGPYGFFATDPEVLSSELGSRGLSVVAAAHVHTLADPASWPVLKEKTQAICRLLSASRRDAFHPDGRVGVLSEGQDGRGR
ncbi:hypothetical protein [Ensifer canadensis]